MARKITTEIFVKEMKEIHGDRYDYSKVEYKSASNDKVCIICPKHGEFYMLPANHRKGDGCPKCKAEKQSIGIDEFVKRAKEKFGNRYDYSKIGWKGTKHKVTIICPEHGEFQQTPENHLASKYGCPKCAKINAHKVKKSPIEGTKCKDLREYRIWKGMKTRVTNHNTDDADRYINRGITCCEEWLNSFQKFYEDMGPCPEGYSIDRIDPNGNYCKENCRWANATTQAQNRGEFNKVFTYNGETHVLKEWARIFGIKYITLYQRLERSKMSFEQAINVKPEDNLTEYNGEFKTLKEWSEIYKIKYETLICRLNKHHWTLEEALTTPYGGRRNKKEIQDIA